jgi:hypothetical protein
MATVSVFERCLDDSVANMHPSVFFLPVDVC